MFLENVVEECAVVVTLDRVLLDTQDAFDRVADGYDRSNAENPILCDMRSRAWAAADAQLPQPARILDLGCGPGCDAERFAVRGHRVTAIDWSPAMVAEARRRIRAAGLSTRVNVQHVGIHQIDELLPAGLQFDAAYSSFGPLNCVADIAGAARMIADRVRPGGLLIASVIGRLCPWEIAVHAARWAWTRALIRFSRELVAVPLEGRTVWTRYYTPAEFERVFARVGFARDSLRSLGLFVPPPYMHAFARRHVRLVGVLRRVEDRVATWPLVRQMGDHFLIVMRKAS
jgi:SAM-dependent methyltransferase